MTGPQAGPPDYDEDDLVEVRFPLAGQAQADRDDWPWRPGVIVERVGEDEWLVLVEDISLAALDGDELVYPTCFRDAGELRPRPGAS
jgi:hypothetical protein